MAHEDHPLSFAGSRDDAVRLAEIVAHAIEATGDKVALMAESEAGQAAIYNTFYTARHLITRPTLKIFRAAAFEAWSGATCA